jgi:peptide/nickel transport system substrate-binding protein
MTGTSRRDFLARALVSTAGLAFLGCQHETRPPSAGGRPARIPLFDDPTTLDFARAQDNDSWRIAHLIGDSLVYVDADMELVPRVARGWEWSDDLLTLTFHLRGDVSWHDGRPVTAQDVVYTWRTLTDPVEGIAEFALRFNQVETVEAVDPVTARVRYRSPFAPAITAWLFPLLPAHHENRATHPLGCGPWRFASHTRGERLVLEANENYWDGAPLLPGLEFTVIRDYGAQVDALRAGETVLAAVYPDLYRQYRNDEEFLSRFAVHTYQVPYLYYIAWRAGGGNPFFDDARVRRAMALALDRHGYLEKIAEGLGTPGVSVFHPSSWAYDVQIEPWPHDPERAADLLERAGWRRPPGGGVRQRDGQPFRFELTYPTGSENERMASWFQARLAEVGVALELDPVEWAVLLERARAGRFEAVMLGRYLLPDPDPYEMLHSSQIGTGVNYAAVNDPQVDAWIETARTTVDREQRRSIYHRLQDWLHEQEPITVVSYPRSRVAVRRDLGGFVVTPRGYLDFWPGPSAWHWSRTALGGPAAAARHRTCTA